MTFIEKLVETTMVTVHTDLLLYIDIVWHPILAKSMVHIGAVATLRGSLRNKI